MNYWQIFVSQSKFMRNPFYYILDRQKKTQEICQRARMKHFPKYVSAKYYIKVIAIIVNYLLW